MDQRQRLRVRRIGEGFADGDLGNAGHRDDVPGTGLLDRHPIQRLGHQQFGQPHIGHRAVPAAPGHRLAAADRSLDYAAQREPAEIGGGIQVGDQGL